MTPATFEICEMTIHGTCKPCIGHTYSEDTACHLIAEKADPISCGSVFDLL